MLTNCNPMLRTTEIPAGAPIKLVFPGCPAGAPDIAPDPRHADRALGDAPVSLSEFAHVMNSECQPNYPGPTVGGLWLTFDDAGRLTAVTEKFES
ncbi:MAG TPA: hypothetical protein VHC49_23135 [Mycobacteriales bacterium]|nr:hypothetical protein [Mycobacteriales bacterium]